MCVCVPDYNTDPKHHVIRSHTTSKIVSSKYPENRPFLTNTEYILKDLCRVKAGFKIVPPQLYFEFRATFWHWLAQRIQNKVEEERF